MLHQERPCISLASDGTAVRVVVRGEVDLSVAGLLGEAVDAALELGQTCWIDLSAVSFIDSSGIHQLLRAQRRATAQATCLLIRPPSAPGAFMPFRVLGLVDRLPFVHDREAAPASVAAGRRRHLHAVPAGVAALG